MELKLITAESTEWDDVIKFADVCSWGAGKALASKMRQNEFLDWERVILACEDGIPIGYCTFAQNDELPTYHGLSPFIGFVFVSEEHRGKRVSERMIKTAMAYAKELGYEKVYIMSGEIGLYEKYGFQKVGDYRTIYDTVDQLFEKVTGE